MSIQELERGWRSEPENEELLAELLRLYERSNLELPVEILAHTRRWRRLANIVTHFFDESIDENSGVSLAELTRREETLACSIPEALGEWFRLLGRRLCHGEDVPLTLGEIELCPIDDRYDMGRAKSSKVLYFYRECQSVWEAGILEEDLDVADPPVFLFGMEEQPRRFERLSEFLLALLMEETLSLLNYGGSMGTLGRFKQGLRSGQDEEQPESLISLFERAFDFKWGLFGEADGDFYWDENCEVLLCQTPGGAAWACATEEGYQIFKSHGILKELRYCTFVLQWDDFPPEGSVLFDETGRGLIWSRLAEESQTMGAEYSGSQIALMVSSLDPEFDFTGIKEIIEENCPTVLEGMEAAWRPNNRGQWNILWPRTLERFIRP